MKHASIGFGWEKYHHLKCDRLNGKQAIPRHDAITSMIMCLISCGIHEAKKPDNIVVKADDLNDASGIELDIFTKLFHKCTRLASERSVCRHASFLITVVYGFQDKDFVCVIGRGWPTVFQGVSRKKTYPFPAPAVFYGSIRN